MKAACAWASVFLALVCACLYNAAADARREAREAAVAELIARAERHVKTLENESAASEVFRVSLHSAPAWARDCAAATGRGFAPPAARDGGAAVAEYYRRAAASLKTPR